MAEFQQGKVTIFPVYFERVYLLKKNFFFAPPICALEST
jgi:hypothetical protein